MSALEGDVDDEIVASVVYDCKCLLGGGAVGYRHALFRFCVLWLPPEPTIRSDGKTTKPQIAQHDVQHHRHVYIQLEPMRANVREISLTQ
jgi:hypothetical protein